MTQGTQVVVSFFWGLSGFVVAMLLVRAAFIAAFKRDAEGAAKAFMSYLGSVHVEPLFRALAHALVKRGQEPQKLLLDAGFGPPSTDGKAFIIDAGRFLSAEDAEGAEVIEINHGWPTCALDLDHVSRGVPLPRRLEAAGYVARLNAAERAIWLHALDHVRDNEPIPDDDVFAFAAEMTAFARSEIRSAIGFANDVELARVSEPSKAGAS